MQPSNLLKIHKKTAASNDFVIASCKEMPLEQRISRLAQMEPWAHISNGLCVCIYYVCIKNTAKLT